jgi:hypothetical protein
MTGGGQTTKEGLKDWEAARLVSSVPGVGGITGFLRSGCRTCDEPCSA